MEAPAGVEYGSVSEWRRSPAEPVTLLTGFTNPSLRPARPKSDKSDAEACLRRRSGHDEALPKSGRISALAGRQGRLRACTQHLQRHHSQPLRILVTTSIIKSDGVPGLRPGAASLFSSGGSTPEPPKFPASGICCGLSGRRQKDLYSLYFCDIIMCIV